MKARLVLPPIDTVLKCVECGRPFVQPAREVAKWGELRYPRCPDCRQARRDRLAREAGR